MSNVSPITNRRAEILRQLVQYEKPTAPLLKELNEFGWDWLEGKPLLVLEKGDLLQIIDRFLSGSITPTQLQEWTENLECREDVAFDKKDENIMDEIFFQIATPFINKPLNQVTVGKMKAELLRNGS